MVVDAKVPSTGTTLLDTSNLQGSLMTMISMFLGLGLLVALFRLATGTVTPLATNAVEGVTGGAVSAGGGPQKAVF